jgi:hypothetical protein
VLATLPTGQAVVLVAGGAIFALAAAWPPFAAYVLLAVTPLVTGLDRGTLVPVLRPSEALAGLLAAALLARGAVELVRGAPVRLRPTAVDATLLAFAVAGSVVPLLWLVARGREVAEDDVLYALQLWKYVAVFLVVRAAVRTEREVARCLWIVLAVTVVVVVVAILQSLGLLGVAQLVATYYTPEEEIAATGVTRGTSTLSSYFALADISAFCFALAAAWLVRGGRPRPLLMAIALVCLLGLGAAGSYSGFLAIPLVVLAVGILTGRLWRFVVASSLLVPLAALAMWPVIAQRLEGFETLAGLPPSWVGRWANLTTFFWPQLADFNWVLGVRPAARLPAVETWRDWIWIESGHTWLLWAGGVPFLLAYFAFQAAGMRHAARAARAPGAIGVAGVTAFASLTVVLVLMLVDAHITLRGSADLLFALLALSLVGAGARAGGRPPRAHGP